MHFFCSSICAFYAYSLSIPHLYGAISIQNSLKWIHIICTQIIYLSFLCGSRVAQWEDEAANVFATRAITCAKCTKERNLFNFLPTLSLIKAWHFSPRLNYSCAFYIFAAFFMHSSPSTWYFVFCVGAPHTPNIHAFFIYIMLEVQHKKSQNICHVECAARAVIFQLSKHLFPREFLWFFYHSFHSRLMSDASRINRMKKTKISSSGRKMRGKFIRERRLIKK